MTAKDYNRKGSSIEKDARSREVKEFEEKFEITKFSKEKEFKAGRGLVPASEAQQCVKPKSQSCLCKVEQETLQCCL